MRGTRNPHDVTPRLVCPAMSTRANPIEHRLSGLPFAELRHRGLRFRPASNGLLEPLVAIAA